MVVLLSKVRAARAKVAGVLMFGFLSLFLLLTPSTAHAQTPTPTPVAGFDYGGLAGTAKGEMNTALGQFMPVVMGIFVTLVAIGALYAWSRRSMKQS